MFTLFSQLKTRRIVFVAHSLGGIITKLVSPRTIGRPQSLSAFLSDECAGAHPGKRGSHTKHIQHL